MSLRIPTQIVRSLGAILCALCVAQSGNAGDWPNRLNLPFQNERDASSDFFDRRPEDDISSRLRVIDDVDGTISDGSRGLDWYDIFPWLSGREPTGRFEPNESLFAEMPFDETEPQFLVYSEDASVSVDLVKRVTVGDFLSLQGGRIRGEVVNAFDGFDQFRGNVVLLSRTKFGIDGEVYSRGDEHDFPSSDDLWHGDLNLIYAYGFNKRLQFRAGAGANWLHIDGDTEYGFNFTYGGDLFLTPLVLLSTDFDVGELNDDDLFHARVTGGVVWYWLEAYIGYDYYKIGWSKFDGLVLGGGLWF